MRACSGVSMTFTGICTAIVLVLCVPAAIYSLITLPQARSNLDQMEKQILDRLNSTEQKRAIEQAFKYDEWLLSNPVVIASLVSVILCGIGCCIATVCGAAYLHSGKKFFNIFAIFSLFIVFLVYNIHSGFVAIGGAIIVRMTATYGIISFAMGLLFSLICIGSCVACHFCGLREEPQQEAAYVAYGAVNQPGTYVQQGRPAGDRTVLGIISLLLNLFICPGVGTLLGGQQHTANGIIQLVLWIAGIFLSAVGVGVALMFVAWIWALISSIQILTTVDNAPLLPVQQYQQYAAPPPQVVRVEAVPQYQAYAPPSAPQVPPY